MHIYEVLLFISCVGPLHGFSNVETRADIPKSILAMFKQHANKMRRGFDTVRGIKPEKILLSQKAVKVVYNLSGVPKNEFILKDQLVIYLSHTGSTDTPYSAYSLKINDLFSGRVVAYQHIRVSSSTWYKVYLKRWTRQWHSSSRSSHGLEITIHRDGEIVGTANPLYKSNDNIPYLLLYCKTNGRTSSPELTVQDAILDESFAKSLPSARERFRIRRTSSSVCNYINITRPIVVNPRVVATLITSLNFTTKKCMGNCRPSPSLSNNSSNCNVSLHNCCVPSKVVSLGILFIDTHGQTVFYEKTNAIVIECACFQTLASSFQLAQRRNDATNIGTSWTWNPLLMKVNRVDG